MYYTFSHSKSCQGTSLENRSGLVNVGRVTLLFTGKYNAGPAAKFLQLASWHFTSYFNCWARGLVRFLCAQSKYVCTFSESYRSARLTEVSWDTEINYFHYNFINCIVFYFGASRIQFKCNTRIKRNRLHCNSAQNPGRRWPDSLFYHFCYFI